MALPKEPRQKMINLMYLVLTALLALNVSSEILNAFKTVDASLINSNGVIDQKNNTLFKSFQDKIKNPETRELAEIWWAKAEKAKTASESISSYINDLKLTLKKEAGYNPPADTSFKEDDLEAATRLFVEKKEGNNLLKRLTQFKQDLLSIDPEMAKEIGNSLPLNLNPPSTVNSAAAKGDWGYSYFHMTPTVAALTILSKFQNDVKNSEAQVVDYCHRKTGEVVLIYDQFQAIASQSSEYLMPGQELTISGGVGAFSKAAQPQITINGQGLSLGEDGQAKLKMQGGGLGKHSVPIVIRFKDQDGKDQVINKTVEYTVGQASASIALDKMNVLYIGVDNPLTIAASGGGDDRIQVSINGGGGAINRVGSGKYIARVNSVTDNCTITVSVDGKPAGASQFRVRTIPDAVATVGGEPSGANIPAGAFKAQGGVAAWVKDFPFELKYTVTSFTLTADTDDGDIIEARCTGNTWSAQAQGVLKGLKAGKTVTIDDIRAQGPDGRNRHLPSLVYYIK